MIALIRVPNIFKCFLSKTLSLSFIKLMFDINICGVLIKNNVANSQFLREISDEYCYVESNYQNLANILKKLDICI